MTTIKTQANVKLDIKKEEDDESIPDEEKSVDDDKEDSNDENKTNKTVEKKEEIKIDKTTEKEINIENEKDIVTPETSDEHISIEKQIKIAKLKRYYYKYRDIFDRYDIDCSDLKSKSIEKLNEIINRVDISLDSEDMSSMIEMGVLIGANMIETLSNDYNDYTKKTTFKLGGFSEYISSDVKVLKWLDRCNERAELTGRMNPFMCLAQSLFSAAVQVNKFNKKYDTDNVGEAMIKHKIAMDNLKNCINTKIENKVETKKIDIPKKIEELKKK